MISDTCLWLGEEREIWSSCELVMWCAAMQQVHSYCIEGGESRLMSVGGRGGVQSDVEVVMRYAAMQTGSQLLY